MLYATRFAVHVFAGSSNGRTIASGAMYLGSSPSPAVLGESDERSVELKV